MTELYLHLHCRRQNGKSPIVARMEAASTGAGPTENSDANVLMDTSTEESNCTIEALDINSLQFTNRKTQAVYVSCNMFS